MNFKESRELAEDSLQLFHETMMQGFSKDEWGFDKWEMYAKKHHHDLAKAHLQALERIEFLESAIKGNEAYADKFQKIAHAADKRCKELEALLGEAWEELHDNFDAMALETGNWYEGIEHPLEEKIRKALNENPY